jgi:hypothetical protein
MKKPYRQSPIKLQFILSIITLLITASSTMAQDGYDPMSYSSLSQVFSSQQYLGSANSAILPSVAMENGYASFIDNPAVMSLIKGSYVNIGYMSNHSEFNQSFRGNELLLDSKADYINNIGVVYKIPTRVGSLVLGGGIHTNSVYNRSLGSSTFNNQSTITDVFKGESSDYSNIAFETYAIDYADQAQTQLESIFRIGFNDGFPGTYQQSELTQYGRSREFYFFMGTEFKKNLHIGFSLGINEAFHNMSRNILEEDLDNVYDGDFIEQDENGENGTDIYSIQLSDELRSDVLGFEARIGAVYQLGQYLNLGASWSLPSIMEITEEYNSTITTSFDNSLGPFFDSFEGEFTYAITRPSKYSLGMAVNQLKGFDLSIGVDFISYNKTDIDLTYDQSLEFDEVAFLRDQEAVIEQSISQRYQSVMNTRIGAQYRFKNGTELRAGTSILPSKSVQIDETRTLYSGGIGIPLSRDFFLDITTQYIQWNDRSVLYEYQDMGSTIPIQESISERNQLVNVLIGIKIKI